MILHRCGESFYFLLVSHLAERERALGDGLGEGRRGRRLLPPVADRRDAPPDLLRVGARCRLPRAAGVEPLPPFSPATTRRGGPTSGRLVRRSRLTDEPGLRSCTSVRVERGGPWDWSRDLREQDGWAEHARFMNGLVDDGFIVLGGPLEGDREVLHVVDACSERGDPRALRAGQLGAERDAGDQEHRALDDPAPRPSAQSSRASACPASGRFGRGSASRSSTRSSPSCSVTTSPCGRRRTSTAFLVSGIAGTVPGVVGEPYCDASGTSICRCSSSPCSSTRPMPPRFGGPYDRAMSRGVPSGRLHDRALRARVTTRRNRAAVAGGRRR